MDLANLDHRARGYVAYGYFNANNWKSLRPADVGRLAQSSHPTILVGLCSFHFSGHVREAAVEELALQRSGKELPFLLIRLNDWVSPVREAAARAVRERIGPAYAIHFLANISLVIRLRICGRADKQFLENVFALLRRPECREQLQGGMASKDKVVRRISFQLAAEGEPTTRLSLIRSVLNDPDASARSWAVRHFLPDVTPDQLSEVVGSMLCDRHMPIRRDALWAVATKRPDLAAGHLRRALLDPHTLMRETARQFLAVAEVSDIREFYVEAVRQGEGPQLVGSICGLGECGMAPDAVSIASYLHSALPKLRRASVYGIGKLDGDRYLAGLTDLLADSKASVSREAMKALLPRAREIPLERLEALFTGYSVLHVRRNVLALIMLAGKWRRLPTLLRACADSDPQIAGLAIRSIRDWLANYNRSFAEPTTEDLEQIRDGLRRFGDILPDHLATELQACVAIFTR